MAVWIDTDMGVDDLFAILHLAAHRPIAGLSLSFGCAGLKQVCANAAGADEIFGWTFPIGRGAARPILGAAETAERILGASGMPTRGLTLPKIAPGFGPALPPLAKWCDEDGEAILALGPLTNLATLALARPDLHLPQITWMGGSLGRGNHTEHAEFNALADPEALAILLDRGVRVRMVDLEACRKVQITESDLSLVSDPLLTDLLGGYLDIGLSRGRPGMALYDPVAAAVLTHPELFTLAPVHLAVDVTRAPTRAKTAIGDGPPNAEVITDLDAAAIRTVCLTELERRI